MVKLKITIDKTFMMDGIDSITLLQNLNGQQIDYRYSDPTDTDPKYNYFELIMNGIFSPVMRSGITSRARYSRRLSRISRA